MKKLLTLLSFLISVFTVAMADGLSVKTATVNPGSSEVTEVTVSLNGSSQYYTAVQMKISIPEGYSFEKSTGKKPAYTSKLSASPLFYDSEEPADHSVVSGIVDGKLNVGVVSQSSTEFYDYSGDLFKFYIKANSWVKPGTVDIKISGASLIAVDGTKTVDLAEQTITTVTASTSCTLPILDGWSTCVFPFTPSLPAGVKVYNATGVSGSEVTLTEATSIEGYKPYVVYNEGSETTLSGTITATYPSAATSNGVLNGVLTATKISAENDYVLQIQSGETAFYQVDPAKPITVPMGKCYLETAGGSAKMYTFAIDETTAIKNVDATEDGESVYDLNGVKVTTARRGVYIKGGKKVVMK